MTSGAGADVTSGAPVMRFEKIKERHKDREIAKGSGPLTFIKEKRKKKKPKKKDGKCVE